MVCQTSLKNGISIFGRPLVWRTLRFRCRCWMRHYSDTIENDPDRNNSWTCSPTETIPRAFGEALRLGIILAQGGASLAQSYTRLIAKAVKKRPKSVDPLILFYQ